MSNSINRRLLNVKKGKPTTSTFNDINDNAEHAEQLCRSKCKYALIGAQSNKILDEITFKSSTKDDLYSPNKFSANDRLKKYRAHLNERKNEVIKVHQVLYTPKNPNTCENSSNINNSVDLNYKSRAILGKRSFPITAKTEQCTIDLESPIKKRKCSEGVISLSNQVQTNINKKAEDDNSMDWSPINENQAVSNIQQLRERCKENPILVSDTPSSDTKINTVKESDASVERKFLYIVVDTNIFISNLSLIKNMLLEDCTNCQTVVYVPWIVLQELDYFKDGRADVRMLNAAQKAIKFINQNLSDKNDRLKGQSVQEALFQKGSSPSADDQILFCCMHLIQSQKPVILLSNDVNLRNKALINNVSSYGPKDILTKIKKLHPDINDENKEKMHKFNSLFANLCTEIIDSEMKEAYGSATYRLITKPPWDIKQCLHYFKRFWMPVFSLIIAKQCLKLIEDLLQFVQICEDIVTEKNMEKFMKMCFSICVYFKNCLSKYEESINSCIENMKEVDR